MRQLRPARKQAVARVRAGTHDYPPPVPDLFILVYHPLCLQDRHEHVLGTVGHTVPTRGMFSGTILYFRYKVTSHHVMSRTMHQLPCYHPSMTAGSSWQGHSMDEYINIIWELHSRCCNILPSIVLSTFLLQVKPGNEFDYLLILAELVWLDLAYAW